MFIIVHEQWECCILLLIMLSYLQRLSQMAIVVFIVVGLFMFTFKSTSFDTEGFVLVSYSICMNK